MSDLASSRGLTFLNSDFILRSQLGGIIHRAVHERLQKPKTRLVARFGVGKVTLKLGDGGMAGLPDVSFPRTLANESGLTKSLALSCSSRSTNGSSSAHFDFAHSAFSKHSLNRARSHCTTVSG